MTRRSALVITPWDVALRMMRNGRDPGLIVAYLEEEARRAGVDPLGLSMHPSDCIARAMRRATRLMSELAGPFRRAAASVAQVQRAASQRDFTLAGPP